MRLPGQGALMIDHTTQQQMHKLTTTWIMLKLSYGLMPIVFGAAKIFNLLTNWQGYINPTVLRITALSPVHLIYIVGTIEITIGLIVLSKFTRIGAYLIASWIIVAGTFFAMGHHYDAVARDLVMAVGALALARITEILHDMRTS